ncbi:hypothetical protein LXA43DRAFT_972873 [Ganoderma leucocontextum]|nr:hypothetical protein LXA43DRAFT_972873 [Ganoderma leucocontextum]
MPTATITETGLRNVFTNVDYIGAAVSTMLAYEYFITIDDEVKYFWKRRSLGPSALFYMNRYLNLVLSIYQLIVLNPAYHRSPERLIPSGLLYRCVSNTDLGVTRYLSSAVSATTESQWIYHEITILARISVILVDLLLVIITWTRLFKQRKLGLRGGPREFTLTDVLLRDGTVYFLIMLLLNCLHIAFTVVSIFIVSSLQHLSSISIFVTPLTAILVSRFMIHLQAADRQSPRHDGFGTDTQASRTDVDTRMTSVIFESVIGSLRCELEPGDLNEAVREQASRDR